MSDFKPLSVDPDFSAFRGYQVATYSAGTGDPVLLVHSVNAAASAFEMRAPFVGLQAQFQVHAIDLLGFGLSDRPARRYAAEDYIDQIGQSLQAIGQPTVLIGNTLGAAYAVAAAARWPHLVRSLVLVCPTGIALLADTPGPAEALRYALLRGPVGSVVYEGLTTRTFVRAFLEMQTYGDPRLVTEETLDGFHQATCLPGAMHAPICFVSGLLACNIATTFASLTQPILLVWGRRAQITRLNQADAFLMRNSRARLEVFDDCGMIVQDERPDEFNQLVTDFVADTPR